MKYLGWLHELDDDSLAQVRRDSDDLEGKNYLLTAGVPLASLFSSTVTYQLSDEHGIKLADSIPNLLGVCFVSETLKTVLARETGNAIEYLPVQLRDPKGRTVSSRYYIANVLGTVDCLDLGQSQVKMSNIIKTSILKFDKLVLDESKIPPEQKIFRLGGKTDFLIVREDLVQALREAGCTGCRFELMERFSTDRKLLRRPELMG